MPIAPSAISLDCLKSSQLLKRFAGFSETVYLYAETNSDIKGKPKELVTLRMLVLLASSPLGDISSENEFDIESGFVGLPSFSFCGELFEFKS